MINNTVAGCERAGYFLDGEPCTEGASRWKGNEVHGAWHGLHIPYSGGVAGCSRLNDFLVWENLDYGIFAWPVCSIIISKLRAVDNRVNVFPNVHGPHILTHKTENKFFILRDSLLVGTSPGYDCSDDFMPEARKPYIGQTGPRLAPGGKLIISNAFDNHAIEVSASVRCFQKRKEEKKTRKREHLSAFDFNFRLKNICML